MTRLEQARALRRDYDDLTRQARETGCYPDPPAAMVSATTLPSIDRWQLVQMPGVGLVLAGWARSHPVLGPSDGWFVSTPLERIDRAGQWAWSKNHLFRLLRPANPLEQAARLADALDHPPRASQKLVEGGSIFPPSEHSSLAGMAF